MAETTDRPQSATEVPSSAAPMAVESYRPLSLLALAGFALAVLYALVVLVGGLVSLLGHIPWLMPGWTFLLPLAAVLVCWAARTRIRASENTLSGLAFTLWGFRVAIVFGLTYTAYYAATFFVVRQGAIAHVDGVLEPLKTGDPERSFLLAVGIPAKEVADSNLRDLLELKHNSPSGQGGVGTYTRFRRSEFVRLIEMGGGKTQIVPLGVVDWSYGKDGYRVVLRYRLATNVAEFEMDVEALGFDSKPGEGKGRRWRIPLDKGGMTVVPDSIKMTERGAELMQKAKIAQTFASAWTDKVNRREWTAAYRDTLPAADRSRGPDGEKIARLVGLAPLAGAALIGLCDAVGQDLLPGQKMLESRKLIHIDDKIFWAGKGQRAVIRQRIEKTFQPSTAEMPLVRLRLQQGMPRMSEKNGRTMVVLDLGLNYLDDNGATVHYVVDGQLVVSAEGSDAERLPSAWKIESIEIETGRTAPAAPRPGQPPNPLGGGGPPQP